MASSVGGALFSISGRLLISGTTRKACAAKVKTPVESNEPKIMIAMFMKFV